MLAKESYIDHIDRALLAIELARVGARPQLIMAETGFSKDRARKIYFEATGEHPAKGQAPYSANQFVDVWRLNIDASLFVNIHFSITSQSQITPIDALIKSYKLYLEHVYLRDTPRDLSFTRAWTLLRLINAGMLCIKQCSKCGGKFIALPSVKKVIFQCVFCRPEVGRRRFSTG